MSAAGLRTSDVRAMAPNPQRAVGRPWPQAHQTTQPQESSQTPAYAGAGLLGSPLGALSLWVTQAWTAGPGSVHCGED